MKQIMIFNQGPQDLRIDSKRILIHAGERMRVDEDDAKRILKIFSGSDQCRIMQCDDKGNLVEQAESESEVEAKNKQQQQQQPGRR
jgi:hypothetical protein